MIKTAASFGRTLVVVVVLALVTLSQSTAGAVVESDPETRYDQLQLLGSSECSFGPSYWCQNMSNAVSCNAVSHCMQTAWITLANSEVGLGSDVCSVCKRGIDKLVREVKKHYDQKRLTRELDLLCDLLVLKTRRAACMAAVDVVLPLIEHAVTQPVDAQHACTELKLCKSSSLDGERATENDKVDTNVEVDAIVTYLLHNSPQSSVQPSLDSQNGEPGKE